MRLFNLLSTSLFLISFNIVTAEWNPAYLLLEKKYVNEILANKNFVNYEKKVCKYVADSWCSEDKAKLIMDLIVLTRPKVCVEIGVFSGATALPILASLKYNKNGEAYLIDAWSNKESTNGLPSNDPNTIWWGSLNMKAIKKQFIQMVKEWGLESYAKIIQTTSAKAVSKIPQIDFLHIDGNFSETGSLKDCESFLPKVLDGGFILVSNVLVMIEEKPTKMRTLWPLFDQCEIVCEIDNGNTLLFKKS